MAGENFGSFAAGLAPHLAYLADRKSQKHEKTLLEKRKDEDDLIKLLGESDNPEHRALSVAALLERATRDPKKAKGKSILDDYVSGANTWRQHPTFQQVGQIAQQVGSLGGELSNMDESGNAISQAGPGANMTPNMPAPPEPPPPGPQTDQAASLATGQAPQGAPPPLAQTSGSPSVAGAGHMTMPTPPPDAGPSKGISSSILSPGQPVGSGHPIAPPLPTPPSAGASPTAERFRNDPYAQTIEQGYQPDAMGGFGAHGEQAFKANVQGQVTERGRYTEEQRNKRESLKVEAAGKRLQTEHENRLEEIKARGTVQQALNEFTEGEKNKRAQIRGGRGGRSGGISPTSAASMRMRIDSDLTNDLQALDREERRAVEKVQADPLMKYDTGRLQTTISQINKDYERAREDTRRGAEQLRTQLDGILGPPGSAGRPSPPPGSTTGTGGTSNTTGTQTYTWGGKTYTWDQLPEEGKAAARRKGVAPK